MKKLLMVGVFIFSVIFSFAQQASWKEMQDFHSVMSVTYHPAEENNLKPVKDSAAVLVQKAKQWQSAKVPTGYNATLTKPVLTQLVADCTQLEAYVKAGKSDVELKKQITKAHETFHEIMEKCRTEKE